MVGVDKVKQLNSKIESINTKRVKAETKKEMLLGQLSDKILKYKSLYGVSLKGKTLKDTKGLISAEVEKVSKQVSEEYELKSKVVACIEAGDYKEAYRLFGKQIEEEPEETEEAQEEVSEEVLEPEIGEEKEDKSMFELSGDDMSFEDDEETEESDDSTDLEDMDFGVDEREDSNDNIFSFGSDDLEIEEDDLELESQDEGVDLRSFDFGFGAITGGSKFDFEEDE